MAAAVHEIVSAQHGRAALPDDIEVDEELVRLILSDTAAAADAEGALLARLDRMSGEPESLGVVGLEQRAIEQILSRAFMILPAQPHIASRSIVLEGGGEVVLFDLSDYGFGPLLIALGRSAWPAAARRTAHTIVASRRAVITGSVKLRCAYRDRVERFDALRHAVDALEAGLLLVDCHGYIIHANQSAAALLATGNGLCRVNGSVRATNLSDAVSLQAALAHASVGSAGPDGAAPSLAPMLTVRRQGAPPLVATVLPMSGLKPGIAAAAIYLIDPRIDAQRLLPPLCLLYRLTPVETRLVGLLVQGVTLMAAAKAMRIKLLTARGYLKQIFVKTETGRQPELIALMLSSLFRVAPRVHGVGLPTHHCPGARTSAG